MGWWTNLQDSIVENTYGRFISDDDVQTAQQVAAAQRAIVERQRQEGLIDREEYLELVELNEDSDDELAIEKEEHSGGIAVGFFKGLPWWAWLLIAAAAFYYFRPLLGLLKKKP